jgi:tetratricopeptide (TPR) repeat protein
MSKDNWLKSDSISTNQIFYIQIAYSFSRTKDIPTVINPVKSNYNFIEPVVLTALLGKKDNLPDSDEYIATKCNELINDGLYDEALTYIDELIKRNPFNKELYQLRISINKALKKNDLILQDAKKLKDFIPGVSLDELIK